MDIEPEVGEPDAGPWQAESLEGLVRRLLPAARHRPNRPWIVAVDGRSGSGKTTLVEHLLAQVPDSAAVHTDDVAWHLSFFDWADQLRDGVLEPLVKGEAVHYRPPGWVARERPGAIAVPAGRSVVWVEGSGSSRRALSHLIDASIWVQCDNVEARRRLRARDGQEEEELHREWEEEEIPFLLEDRPWERAAVIVAGMSAVEHDPKTQVVTAQPAPARAEIT
ncbi:energy-coupling factor transporter ATP-binding protein EcfA2 [Pseudarthrobacter sp. W1I19]|uniref:uridine kinase family protein n=1 Tax=Pseudarthrobacter sp. W1I19 TaxID=3042288 RepID=UPI00278BA67B|nr:hypothetical protein [Pseudarthrobacter sp. W1I19]MDQ0923795.1 energy-coupling factor transporter ATP-binding protein EcfA2 [Pseudarthrobacter sp. W1I19]